MWVFIRILGIYLASYGSVSILVNTNALYKIKNVAPYKNFCCQLLKYEVLF